MWQVKINKSITIGAYHLGMRRFFYIFLRQFDVFSVLPYESSQKT